MVARRIGRPEGARISAWRPRGRSEHRAIPRRDRVLPMVRTAECRLRTASHPCRRSGHLDACRTLPRFARDGEGARRVLSERHARVRRARSRSHHAGPQDQIPAQGGCRRDAGCPSLPGRDHALIPSHPLSTASRAPGADGSHVKRLCRAQRSAVGQSVMLSRSNEGPLTPPMQKPG
jgi:hypothetical protein